MEDEMTGACNMHEKGKRCMHYFGWET